jgi:hypothetical protein
MPIRSMGRDPGPPGFGLGVGLKTPSCKNNFVQKPNTRWRLVVEEAKAHPGLKRRLAARHSLYVYQDVVHLTSRAEHFPSLYYVDKTLSN